jgi:nucleoid-associated protein YgaU
MSPEKVAILVVAGLIAVLLAVALLGTEPAAPPASSEPEKARVSPERIRPMPKQLEEYTYEDVLNGASRARPQPKVVAQAVDAPKQKSVEYVVKKNDTIEKIARRELGSPSYVGKILSMNKGVNPSRLAIGAKLNLPVVRPEARAVAASAARPQPMAARAKRDRPTASAGKL